MFYEKHPTSFCVYTQVHHFASTEKCSITVGKKPATNCPFVRLLVAQNDKAKKIITTQDEKMSEERSCGQESHRYEERWDHTCVYS